MTEEEKLPLKERVESLKNKHNNVSMEIETLEEEESLVGPRERKLTESCKKLGINPAIYHGGDLEGKTVQTMLNCARKPHKFELLECLEDKADEREKYVRALSTLTKVSDALKTHKRRWLASKFAPFLPKLAPFSGEFFCPIMVTTCLPKARDGHHMSPFGPKPNRPRLGST